MANVRPLTADMCAVALLAAADKPAGEVLALGARLFEPGRKVRRWRIAAALALVAEGCDDVMVRRALKLSDILLPSEKTAPEAVRDARDLARLALRQRFGPFEDRWRVG